MDEPLLILFDKVSRVETLGGLALLLALESLRPFLPERDEWTRIRHVTGNFSLWVLGFLLADVLLYPHVIPASLFAAHGPWHTVLGSSPLWAQAILGVLLLDLAAWLLHWLSHRYRWLWLIHAVHHSDPHLDATTSMRNHPLELVLSLLWHALIMLVLGLPVWVVALRAIVAVPIAMLHHSNVRVPDGFDRAMRAVFVSPAMHRVHHSPVMPETNSNYAVVFSFWDRLFGTYHAPRTGEPVFGLNALRAPAWQSVWGMLATPIRARRLREF